MIVIVKVTKNHIRTGIACSTAFCPIALAIHEMVRNSVHVSVIPECVSLTLYVRYTIDLPIQCSRFIKDFDYHKFVDPITFTLDIPERFLKGAA